MRLLSLLAISLFLPISAWSKDEIQFWSQPQTCPGKNLEIKVERQKRWDQQSRTWISDPSSLGKFRIHIYRHDPSAKFFSARFSSGKGASWVGPDGHPSNGELLFAPAESRYPVSGVGSPIVIALGNPKEKKQEKRGFQNVWVWPKRINLPPSAQVFEGEQDASASAKLLIPAQSPGTYIVEIQQGEARAFLPWRVSDLALRVERIENRVVFHALRSSDGAPIPDGQLKVKIRTRDERDWQKQTIDEKNLGLNRKGMVELPLGKRQSLFEAELHARDECLRTEFDEDSLLWGRSNYEERPEAKPNMAFAYTDRPVYKPGDELFVKMVMYSTDLDPDRDLVSVYSSISTGSNERPFASRNWYRDESSSDSLRAKRSIPFPGMESLGLEYSISGPPMPRQLTGVAALIGGSPLRFAGGMKLPSSLKPGSYTLSFAQGGSRIHFNPVTFEVQDYEKPRFSIRILEPTSHKEREGLNFTVEAKGVDGNPVSGARGQWNLFRLSRRQEKTWFDAGPALELKSRGELSCDAKGAAPLHLPSNLVDASSEYRLLVKLTDLSGQRRMASHTIGKNSGAVRIVLDRCFAMLGEGVRMGAEVDGKASPLKLEVFEAKSPETSFWTEPSHLTCGEKVLDVDPSGALIRLKAGVYAAGHSDGKHLELLLHAGAHVSHRDMDGDTAITEAILAGRSSLIPVLLRAGAKPEDAFRGDWDALAKAVKTGKVKESFAQLAEKDEHPRSGTDPGAVWTQGALVTAVLKGDLEFIQTTEAAGVDLTVPWRKGHEPLQIALEFRNLGKKPDSFLDSWKPMVIFAEAWYRKRDESTQVCINPSATQTDAGFYCPFSAQVTGSNAQEVKWSIEGNPEHASIDQEGVFRASQAGLYRVIAVSSKDPSLRGVAMVKVKNAIHEDAIAADIPKTHGGVSFAYLQDFQVLQIGGWSGKVPMDLVLQWKGDESAPIHAIGHLKEPRMHALCASLGNGKVLICDGMGQAKGTSTLLRSAEVFDVKRGTSESIPSAEGISTSTYYAHCGGIICTLKDGRVLLLGGDDGNETCSGAELYDPTRNQFQRLDSRPFPVDASCVQLEDGRVLIFGGRYLKGRNKGPSQEIISFDPEKRAFTSFGKLLTARYGQASTLSFSGKILISGGCVAGRWSNACKPTTDCELFDPTTGKSQKVGPMSEAKSYHAAAQIPTGQILTFGGLCMLGHSPLLCRTMEQFDPDSALWQIFNHPKTGVVDPVLYLLPSGSLFNGGSTVEFDPAKRDKREDGVEPTPELCH